MADELAEQSQGLFGTVVGAFGRGIRSALDVAEQQFDVLIGNDGKVAPTEIPYFLGRPNRDPLEFTKTASLASDRPNDSGSNRVRALQSVPPSLLVGGGIAAGLIAIALLRR